MDDVINSAESFVQVFIQSVETLRKNSSTKIIDLVHASRLAESSESEKNYLQFLRA